MEDKLNFYKAKLDAIEVAAGLEYGGEVILDIIDATSEGEIQRILTSARQKL